MGKTFAASPMLVAVVFYPLRLEKRPPTEYRRSGLFLQVQNPFPPPPACKVVHTSGSISCFLFPSPFRIAPPNFASWGRGGALDLEEFITSTVEAFRFPVEICDLSCLQGVFSQSALRPHQLERDLPMRRSWQIDAHPGWLQVAPRWGAHM